MGKTYNDEAISGIRTTVTSLEQELATPSLGPDTLRALTTKLVEQLALEPAALTRDCPVCGSSGMRAASRCGTCWAKLTPEA